MKRQSKRSLDQLLTAVASLRTKEETRMFLRDLLTESELQEFAARWNAARMLAAGIPYAHIVEETGLSTRTIARVQRWLHDGAGGYTRMMKRLPDQLHPPYRHSVGRKPRRTTITSRK